MKLLKLIWLSIPMVLFYNVASGGDAAAGKATFEAKCADCHYADDFAGEAAGNIVALIGAEKTKAAHEGKADLSALSDADVANVAAFLASAK